jgi:hypothetical protein
MNKTKKVIYTFLLLAISFLFYLIFFGSSSGIEKEIVQGLEEEFPEENFYFIYGLDRERSIATNIKYRGIVYSDRLAEMSYPQGLEIALENSLVPEATMYNIARGYEAMFRQIEIDGMVEEKAIEIFGNKCNLYNDWSMNQWKYAHMKKIIGKENLTYDEKNGAYSTIVNVFVDNLEELNIEEYKKKTYELSKYIYEYMNYVTSLQVYVRDNSYFDNYNLVKYSIYRPFRDREDIKKILEKIENKQEISEEEKIMLVRSFRKGGLDYDNTKINHFGLRFKEKIENPINMENLRSTYLNFNEEE